MKSLIGSRLNNVTARAAPYDLAGEPIVLVGSTSNMTLDGPVHVDFVSR